MKLLLLSFVSAFLLVGATISAQPIKTPYVFVSPGNDTTESDILPIPPLTMQRVSTAGGHFITGDFQAQRIRFFGTELEWTSQFMTGADAKVLAKHLHKLGFNAVRFVDNDYYYWNQASFFDNVGKTSSYNVNPDQVAKFDTLIYELKKQGIYSFLVLNSIHNYFQDDGVAEWDTIHSGGQFVHFIDKRAAELHRNWAKTMLMHVNPLTGLTLGDDPAVAAIEVASSGLSLLSGWRYGYLNWVSNANVVTNGGVTIGWNRSRRLDTLFSQYLLHKYGSDAGINNGWKGSTVINPSNLIADGSFEDIGSAAWSFNAVNGATGGSLLFSPAKDSQYCLLIHLTKMSANPVWNDAYLQNASARLGKDSLYDLTFYAKIHYDPAKPVLTRPMQIYLAQYQTGAVALSMTQAIDTNWTKYSYTFRAQAGGLQILYVGLGQQLGDVMLDGFSIKARDEYGLLPGESSSNASITRIKYGESNLLPHQRVRDMALFYDSLQTDYFSAMKKCIADTIKSPVMVDFYAPEYWGTTQDAYANRAGDFAQAHINTDYPNVRDANTPYSDSTWVMLNNSLLRDANNSTMGYLASQSIAGKPFIGRYMNLVTNQNAAAEIPFFTSYASLQDWDGLFFSNYATYYEDLFSNVSSQTSWWSIAGDPALLVQMPQASDAFRNEKIKASATADTLVHDQDDVLLKSLADPSPLSVDYTAPMGVEGSLNPNIATQDLIRQKFDVPVHRLAAEYPYLADTGTKISSTNELRWSQTGGYFTANAKGFSAAAGVFGGDTTAVGNLRFRRYDTGADLQSILLTQLSPSTMLLTIATRSQNSRAVWQYHDSSIGKHWGEAPTIMSVGRFEFFVTSDSNQVIVHPLDSTGNIMWSADGVKIAGTNTFKITIDQSVFHSPWFFIESKGTPSSGVESVAASPEIVIMPNPVKDEAHIRLTTVNSGNVKASLFDDLGREVSTIINGELYQGSHDLHIDARELSAGHYTLRVDCNGKTTSESVNVVK